MTDALEVYDGGALLTPAAPLPDIVRQFGEYRELCAALLTSDDWQTVRDRSFLKRSGWRKLATAMGVTLELLDTDSGQDAEGRWWARCRYRATAPNGRYADALGACHQTERAMTHPMHDVIATADTRAKSRACADLFGLGQLSAEEVIDVEAPAAAVLPAPGGAALDSSGPPWSGELRAFRIACRNLAEEVRLREPGFDPDRLRHDVVRSATGGRVTSSAALTAAEMPAVWAELERAREELGG